MEIKESLRGYELAIQRAKRELAESEQGLKVFLQEHKEELDVDMMRFYYWETSLRTSIISEVLGLKNAGAFIGKATKGYWFNYRCCKCGKDFKYYPKQGEVKDNELIINDDRLCYKCAYDIKEEEQNQKRELYKQTDDTREQAYIKRVNALKYMPYNKYLQTEHWKEISQRARKRAGYKCQLCNSDGLLHVHHRTYENRGEENNSDLIVLCESCHKRFHGKEVE